MISYPGFDFAAPRRCRVPWFVCAAESVGLGWRFLSEAYEPFNRKTNSVPKVSVVRHPCDWLAADCAARYGDNEFDSFVRQHLQESPRGVSEMFANYNADIVLRVEDFPWCFVSFLESIGLERSAWAWNWASIDYCFDRELPGWNPALRDRIVEVEQDFIERYYYDSDQ